MIRKDINKIIELSRERELTPEELEEINSVLTSDYDHFEELIEEIKFNQLWHKLEKPKPSETFKDSVIASILRNDINDIKPDSNWFFYHTRKIAALAACIVLVFLIAFVSLNKNRTLKTTEIAKSIVSVSAVLQYRLPEVITDLDSIKKINNDIVVTDKELLEALR